MWREAALSALEDKLLHAEAREAAQYRAPAPIGPRPKGRSKRDEDTPGEL